MRNYIQKLINKENLSPKEIHDVMHQIMSGKSQEKDVEDFLVALNEKGPTIDEITAASRLLQKFSVPVKTRHRVILDTCGTGGDKKETFNISTIAAFVVAGQGVAVAKHGNRSVSSRCGSADILEALGIRLDLSPEQLGKCLDQVGIAFLFAQKLHPAMKNVASARKALGRETIFNILGPLLNPARATHQIVGVYHRDFVEPLAHVLKNLHLKRAMVVHGADGMDEVTTTAKTFVAEWDGRKVISYDVDPTELGVKSARPEDLKGGDFATNVAIANDILSGSRGPKRDIVVLNAGYAFYIVGKVTNVAEGIKLAEESIDSGKARKKLEELKNFTQGA